MLDLFLALKTYDITRKPELMRILQVLVLYIDASNVMNPVTNNRLEHLIFWRKNLFIQNIHILVTGACFSYDDLLLYSILGIETVIVVHTPSEQLLQYS